MRSRILVAYNLPFFIENDVQVIPAAELDIAAFKEAVHPVYDQNSDRFGDYIERIKAN